MFSPLTTWGFAVTAAWYPAALANSTKAQFYNTLDHETLLGAIWKPYLLAVDVKIDQLAMLS